MKTIIADVITYLEDQVPLAWQESYDNCGLLVGQAKDKVTGVLLTLDCTEEVVEEAVDKGCNLIIAHHPIWFKSIKKLTGSTYVERTLIRAIKENISLYAAHTNWDHYHQGVNQKIADKLGLQSTRILTPRADNLMKLVTFVPQEARDTVIHALHQAGAGKLGHYERCSFQIEGKGHFTPTDQAHPHIGTSHQAEQVDETRIEVILPKHRKNAVLKALKQAHPYEEVAYYLHEVQNINQETGLGMMGELPEPISTLSFLHTIKTVFKTPLIKHTKLVKPQIKTVAVCGGSGGFLLPEAKRAGADLFVTADVTYHQFFDSDNQIIMADIGHFESEQFTVELYAETLSKEFTNFAFIFSTCQTNPIHYL